MAVTRALADENRVRIVGALSGGEVCVCQLIELLKLAPSTVSKHLAILRQARLIESRKDGRWIYYRLAADDDCPEVVRKALAWTLESLGEQRQTSADSARLQQILQIDRGELCCRQRETAKA